MNEYSYTDSEIFSKGGGPKGGGGVEKSDLRVTMLNFQIRKYIPHLLINILYSKMFIAYRCMWLFLQRVLKDLIQEKLPRVASHLEQYSVDLSLFTFNWFLTVFVDNIPIETFLRIWDAFLFEGSKVKSRT